MHKYQVTRGLRSTVVTETVPRPLVAVVKPRLERVPEVSVTPTRPKARGVERCRPDGPTPSVGQAHREPRPITVLSHR